MAFKSIPGGICDKTYPVEIVVMVIGIGSVCERNGMKLLRREESLRKSIKLNRT